MNLELDFNSFNDVVGLTLKRFVFTNQLVKNDSFEDYTRPTT